MPSRAINFDARGDGENFHVRSLMSYIGSRGIAPLILNLGGYMEVSGRLQDAPADLTPPSQPAGKLSRLNSVKLKGQSVT
jgi:hypothetical protein